MRSWIAIAVVFAVALAGLVVFAVNYDFDDDAEDVARDSCGTGFAGLVLPDYVPGTERPRTTMEAIIEATIISGGVVGTPRLLGHDDSNGGGDGGDDDDDDDDC